MRSTSLAYRLFLSAAIASAVLSIAIGLVLAIEYRNYYEGRLLQSLDEVLKYYVGQIERVSAGLQKEPDQVNDPRYSNPLSGWYWQIAKVSDGKFEPIFSSGSLFVEKLPRVEEGAPADPEAVRSGYIEGPADQTLLALEQQIDFGENQVYAVTVTVPEFEVLGSTYRFVARLGAGFFALAIGLVGIMLYQVRYGLRPLAVMREQLAAIREGSAGKLEGRFPDEIAPLSAELNLLLDSNREIVERARTHVGNLAHGLKTPLAVIANEARTNRGPFADKVSEQADIMGKQISHHLERARLAAGVAAIGAVTEVKPVVESLARTMTKVYRDRDLLIDVAAEDLKFRGERQDLEEMVGNLVDNACKWADAKVAIEIVPEQRPDPSARAFFRVFVDDDGPGLTPAQCEEVLKRGRRLDETKPGSGLGLSIVADLARLYGGKLTLGTGPAGGLRCDLLLPAV